MAVATGTNCCVAAVAVIGLERRQLGATGISVSPIGLGTVKFGRTLGLRYPAPPALPDDAAIDQLLGLAKAQGINLLDTAPAYGSSEERLGRALRHQRSDWVIATKVGEEFSSAGSVFDFSPAAIVRSVQRSLDRLRTDYIDVLLLHSEGNDEQILAQGEVVAALAQMKSRGLVRAIGLSTKTVAGGLAATRLLDVVMIPYSAAQTDHRPVIEAAHQQNKGVLIKKGLNSGRLSEIAAVDPVAAALRFVLGTPGVASVVVGTTDPSHLRECVDAARKYANGAHPV